MDSVTNLLEGFLTTPETIPEATAEPSLLATPRRKQNAMIRAQTLESSWMTELQLVSFINFLEGDVIAADTYTVLQGDILRHSWVRNKLGIPRSSSPSFE